jgi:hypothetical protein
VDPRYSPNVSRHIRAGLPSYVFAGSDDPVGQRLKGIEILIERYREAGIRDITHRYYPKSTARNAKRDQS